LLLIGVRKMPITPHNILRHELIGLQARITASKNKKNIGIAGQVVDETYKTLVIEHGGRPRQLLKKLVTLELQLPDKRWVEVRGELLVGRPWERIKKKLRY